MSALLVLKLLLLRMLFFDRIAWEWVLADAAPVLLLMGILAVVVPSMAKNAAFWIFNGLLSLLLFAASVYFNHFGSVPTYLALYELNQVFEIRDSVKSTIQLVDYLFFADIAVYVIYRLFRRWKPAPRDMRSAYAPPKHRACIWSCFWSP